MAKYRNVDWKRNILKIPDTVNDAVTALNGSPFRVGCVRKLSLAEIQAGKFSHLGLALNGDKIFVPPAAPPPGNSGKFSDRNVNDRIGVVRKDLPKVPKDIYLGQRPIYGDWSKGSFDLWVTKMVYPQVDELADKIPLRIRVLTTEDIDANSAILVFEIDHTLVASSQNFDAKFFTCLNLLQENVGTVDIISTAATDDDLLSRIYVNWQLLPPGARDVTLAAILQAANPNGEEFEKNLRERYDLLAGQKPQRWIVGAGGFHGYFGALFPSWVILENVKYGNACYVFERNNWQGLSQLSRTELLRDHGGEFQRVVHRGGWEQTVMNIIKSGPAGLN